MMTTERIIGLLAEGPALTGEVAAEIGVTSSTASSFLRHLERGGRVSRALIRVSRDGPGRKVVSLWSGMAREKGEA